MQSRLRRPSPGLAVILAALVLAQWAIELALIGFSARALLLSGLTILAVAVVADASGGPAVAIAASLAVLALPAFSPFWRADFRPQWRHEVLPVLYGAHDSARLLAGLVLLLGVLCLLRLPPLPGVAAAVVSAAAAAAIVRVDQADIAFHWSALRLNLSRIREVGWSVRVVEYLPLAGLLGLAIRRRRAAAPLLGVFAAAAVFPLGTDHGDGLARAAIACASGLPAYVLLAGCAVLLIPEPLAARVAERARAHGFRR